MHSLIVWGGLHVLLLKLHRVSATLQEFKIPLSDIQLRHLQDLKYTDDSKTLSLIIYWRCQPSTRRFIPHSPDCVDVQESALRSPRCPPAEWSFGVCRSASSQTVSHKRPGPRWACSSPHWSPWWKKGARERGEPEVRWFMAFALIPLTTQKHNSSQKDGKRELNSEVKSGAGCSHVPEGTCRQN